MTTTARQRSTLLVPCAAALGCILALGCRPDPFADGRYWRQPPTQKKSLRPMAATTNVFGGTSQSGVGPGFTITGQWGETAGPLVSRAGHTARSDRYNGTSTVVGDAGVAARYGVWTESTMNPGVTGGTMRSGSFDETSTRTGTTP